MWPSFVGLAPVSHTLNLDGVFGIVDGIDDTVISDAYSPHVFLAMQLAAPMRTRLVRQSLYFRKYPPDEAGIKGIQFLLGGTVEPDRIFSHSVYRAGGDGPSPLRGSILARGHVLGR